MSENRFRTDNYLISMASRVRLSPPRNKAVFYADPVGRKRSYDFVKKNPEFLRLDELLEATGEGRNLNLALDTNKREWSEIEEVWLCLSMRLAHKASGNVYCFGPDRLVRAEPIENFEHPYTSGAYANTQFEKAELPILYTNPNVDQIWMNGKLYS